MTKQSTFEIAQAACQYSRGFILKGSTQIINNDYDRSQKLALVKAVGTIRGMYDDNSNFYDVIDITYQKFQHVVELCKKFSLGNCYEMAFVALDYVVRYAPPSIQSEVYCIDGGDHVFIVIGRDPKSSFDKPETWGKDAYICDPWSNKVYPASDYLNQLQNYFYKNTFNGDWTNHL